MSSQVDSRFRHLVDTKKRSLKFVCVKASVGNEEFLFRHRYFGKPTVKGFPFYFPPPWQEEERKALRERRTQENDGVTGPLPCPIEWPYPLLEVLWTPLQSSSELRYCTLCPASNSKRCHSSSAWEVLNFRSSNDLFVSVLLVAPNYPRIPMPERHTFCSIPVV
ncbi:unnamed protein product [Cyprideis torosa]|uniref:Uncharacterized protein n=1 Tax=Cyprideis torosa TaxID=163714 RepID=A0A7R8WFP6_9CRUS|nr:unnamed protein product [Cyprideis torosa]CAG0897144.1 unnamed protein product [Cyprideis torosa]